MSTTNIYGVTGMTCGHCVTAVTREIGRIPGVDTVVVDLAAGGVSTVTVESTTDLDEALVREAVDEAGYELAPLPA